MFTELIVVGVFNLGMYTMITQDWGTWGRVHTLWKSYLFNCLTKLAKFECLNIRGRIDFVNSFMSYHDFSVK